MRRVILLLVSLLLPMSALAQTQELTWDQINAGEYPTQVRMVVFPDTMYESLIDTFVALQIADQLDEWVYCLKGDVVRDTIILNGEYTQPQSIHQGSRNVGTFPCGEGTVARLHPHFHTPAGKDSTCYWQVGDALSFKNEIAYAGFPLWGEAILCWKLDGSPDIYVYTWNDLKIAEDRAGSRLTLYTREWMRERFMEVLNIDLDTLRVP